MSEENSRQRREARIAPSKAPRRGEVIAVTSDKGKELDDTRLMARALHGAAADVQHVDDKEDLVQYLAQFEYIRRLVCIFHGFPGGLLVGDDVIDFPDLVRAMARAGSGKVSLRCDEIVFEGCNVGCKTSQMARLLTVLQARSATGYGCFHAWYAQRYAVGKGILAKSIEQDLVYRKIQRFLVAGQPRSKEIAASPRTYSLLCEFFSATPTNSGIFQSGQWGEIERLTERSRLERITLKIGEASSPKIESEYDTPIGRMAIISVVP